MCIHTIKKHRGFTLIELLVVIAIISLLSSVILASINNLRAKARDSKRIQTVKEIQKALELYYEKNGQYPPIQHMYTANDDTSGCGHNDRWCTLEDELSAYIDTLPKNEPTDNTYYYMYYASSGDNYQKYGVGVRLETDHAAAENDGGYYPSTENTESGNEDIEAFEAGTVVTYCMSNYTGSDADWFWKGSGNWSTVCQGGN